MTVRHILATAALIAAAAPSGLFAQDVGLIDTASDLMDRQDQPGPLLTENRIYLQGAIALRCGIAFESTGAEIDLTAARSIDVGFGLECNAPFRLTGRSANGGLRRINAGSQPGFREQLGYRVTWPSLVNWGGAPVGAQLTGSAAQWSGGRIATSSTPISLVSGAFTIAWDDPANLMAGAYDETFTVEIEVIN